MNAQQERLIRDNPNLSNEVLAKLIGISRQSVWSFKKRNDIVSNWTHSGNKIPFFHSCFNVKLCTVSKVLFGGVSLHEGSFKEAMINVDRLIYCLDNDGKHLLKTL
jgi:DNA-binding XRE family transcriptional regulator